MASYRAPTDQEQAAAKQAGALRALGPCAMRARFDAGRGRIVLELDRGVSLAFEPAIYPDLASAGAADLAEVEILGAGTAINFPRIDVSLSLEILIADLLGSSNPGQRNALSEG